MRITLFILLFAPHAFSYYKCDRNNYETYCQVVCGTSGDVVCTRHKLGTKKRAVCSTINYSKKTHHGPFFSEKDKLSTDVCGSNKKWSGDQGEWCQKQIKNKTTYADFCQGKATAETAK